MSDIYTPHPLRIQRKRTKGWKMPEGAVYVGRPTKWGNPFNSDDDGDGAARIYGEFMEVGHLYIVALGFTELMHMKRREILAALPELRGKKLACWCPLDKPCHADVLARLANARN